MGERGLSGKRLGLVGAGNMAEALCRAVLKARVVPADRIMASDVSQARRDLFGEELAVPAVDDNKAVIAESDVVVLAVKPQQMAAVLHEVGPRFKESHLVITIAAGVRSATIESAAAVKCRVVRVMPNTPMLIGEGMAALCRGAHATEEDLETASVIFRAAGRAVTVEEGMMDAVTAVSGSGPAYIFYFVEAMIEAGIAEGLAPDTAALLAKQTALGAGRLLMESDDPPEELRRKVTSPGGTTQAAIRQMASDGVKEAIVRAARAAAARSRELGKG